MKVGFTSDRAKALETVSTSLPILHGPATGRFRGVSTFVD